MQQKTSFQERYGPWALVTGASSGIGAAFARELAGRGLNVVVAARRRHRLDALVRELEHRYRVRARAVAVDLTAPDYLEVLTRATEGLEIGLLVNNAGAGVVGAFLKGALEDYAGMMRLNVEAPTQLARVYGERMRRRGRGGILFVSSTAAYSGVPYIAQYAATKGYLLNLGAALHAELKKVGVDVLVLSPGPTRTEITAATPGVDFSNVPMYWMEPEDVARIGVRALGRRATVVAGGVNKVLNFLMSRLMPRQAAATLFGSLLSRAMDPAIR